MKTKKKIFKFFSENRRLMTFAAAAAVFILMLALNAFTPYTSDDYSYHFVYETPLPTENSRLLSGIGDIPCSMANHYNVWGGRVVAHSIVQFFMLFDKWVFNIFNSLIFALCGILIYLHIEKDFRKHTLAGLTAVYCAMWFLIPQFGISVLWVSGACNYIWMAVLILLFLLPYRYGLNKKLSPLQGILAAAAMVPFGFIAGCTNENAGGAAVLTAVMLTGMNFLSRKRMPIWSAAGILSAALGVIFLVIAPGNTARGGEIKLSREILEARFERIIDYTEEILLIPLICFAALVVLFCFARAGSLKKHLTDFYTAFILFICAGANIVVLAATSSIYRRSWLLSVFYIVIACGLLIKSLKPSKIRKIVAGAAVSAAAALFVFSYGQAFHSIITTYSEVSLELHQIQEQKAAGIKDVTVTPHKRPTNEYNALYGTANLTDDRDQWFNLWIAKYYGVESVGLMVPEKE